jgi:hypothetical protein
MEHLVKEGMALLGITLPAVAVVVVDTMAAAAEHQHKITDQDGLLVVGVAHPF